MDETPAAAREAGVDLSVTFDDGNASDLAIAAPLLGRLGIRGVVFPCAGRLGRPGYLDAPGLRDLRGHGFDIGSHGMDHLPWSSMDGAGLEREIGTARSVLEMALGEPVAQAALPFGAYDRRVLAALRQAGFDAVHSSDPGLSQPGDWMRRRWCWVRGSAFDVAGLVALSRRPGFRLVNGAKRLAKRWR
jgi:peptidoglycan/xylan/chitin deacetylase (PgdA/CDA1 family)